MGTAHTDMVCFTQPRISAPDIPQGAAAIHCGDMDYAQNLVRLRKKRSLTQTQLAELVGVEQPTVQRWESGKREPSLTKLGEIAKVLNVDAAYFFPNIAPFPWGLPFISRASLLREHGGRRWKWRRVNGSPLQEGLMLPRCRGTDSGCG